MIIFGHFVTLSLQSSQKGVSSNFLHFRFFAQIILLVSQTNLLKLSWKPFTTKYTNASVYINSIFYRLIFDGWTMYI